MESKWTSAGRKVDAPMEDSCTDTAVRLRPQQVTWEMTRGRGGGGFPKSKKRLPRDLEQISTAEAFHLIEQVAAMHVPLLALTGGDPLSRHDLFPVVEFASKRSVRTSLTLIPAPTRQPGIVAELKASGLMRASFWLHGSTPSLNDSHSGAPGAHRRTLEWIGSCHEVQLPVQVNTMMGRHNFHDVDSMIELLIRLDVMLWNVFFYVPTMADDRSQLMTAAENEEIFGKLYAASKRVHFQIKTTEGPQYQRYLLQQHARESRGRLTDSDVMRSAMKNVNDGKGSVFINHRGEAFPSRFLPLSAGDVTRQSLAEVYCNSPLFTSLRDSSCLKGRCGRCAARSVCGGSRARAYAMTGDLFAEDPGCAYQP